METKECKKVVDDLISDDELSVSQKRECILRLMKTTYSFIENTPMHTDTMCEFNMLIEYMRTESNKLSLLRQHNTSPS